jgi:ArsR family transcriptional regulator, arsenate/arsenite/antimonite-responsive transcriptional repressor
MSSALPVITPRRRGAACCQATPPAMSAAESEDLGALLRALSEPIRLRVLEVLRTSAPEAVCQCEFAELFDVPQPTMSKHLKRLVDTGVVAVERRGAWAYYFIPEDSRIKELSAWLS